MEKVIFVGVHNKPGKSPLCSSTYSGKIIDRVIKQLNCECVKTNMWDVEYEPRHKSEKMRLANAWHRRIETRYYDIIVLLGKDVHDYFVKIGRTLEFPHPSGVRFRGPVNRYIENMAKIICEQINSQL